MVGTVTCSVASWFGASIGYAVAHLFMAGGLDRLAWCGVATLGVMAMLGGMSDE